MRKAGWHMRCDDAGVLTLSRSLPARFDFAAQAEFPLLRRGRLAHLIRQDMWRALQHLRGFSPVVELRKGSGAQEGMLIVRAGGAVAGQFPRALAQDTVQTLLGDAKKRARWLAHARLEP
ncbi:hypothetical protein AQS8620_02108 [Aquimixticola soesokkakensis]|uniref:Uncharacterized protein n=1 Tax=Aquimixticola soesokkakensis TaxID=1519096 RepID=A0A1Y5SVR3_9RHOB|nr:hypothetical protein [Aquimixticola soesokkakensis]SLN49425.1 hypothetical protein AQS8620_02108 [Aquimixticola soesokkakensis]